MAVTNLIAPLPNFNLGTDQISCMTTLPCVYGNQSYYDTLYIGTSNGHLWRYFRGGNTLQSIPLAGYTLSGEITGINVDPNGTYLFVSAPYDNHLLRIATSQVLTTLTPTSTTSFASGFSGIRGIIQASDGNFYTASSQTGGISKISLAGVVTLNWVSILSPRQLCQASDGKIYVASSNGTVSQITLGGQVVQPWATVGGPADQLGIVFANDGNLYVTNKTTSTISKITLGGLVTLNWVTTGMSNPSSVYQANDGYLYVTNIGDNTITRIGLDGTVIQGWATNVGNGPRSLIQATDGNLYVACYEGNSISKVSLNATVTLNWLFPPPSSIFCLCQASDGNMYTTNDIAAGVILKTTLNNSTPVDGDLYRLGDNTGGIAIDSVGTVYFVSDNGKALSLFGNYGVGTNREYLFKQTQFGSAFRGLTMSPDDQRLFVADPYTGNIYSYDFGKSLTNLTVVKSLGPDSQVYSIAVTTNNLFYTVVDTIHSNIGVYQYNFNEDISIRIAGAGTSTTTDIAENYKMYNPFNVAVDLAGVLYTASQTSSGAAIITGITFYNIVRNPIAAPVPSPKFPNCGLPAPGNCKKVVIPYNPTTYWGFLPPNRVVTQRPPLYGANSLANCDNTFYQLCPTIPPSRVQIVTGTPPPKVLLPNLASETSTIQYTTRFVAGGYRNNIGYNTSSPTVNTLYVPNSGPAIIPLTFGPLSEVYVTTRSGVVFQCLTGQGTQYPNPGLFYVSGTSMTYPPSVSPTGYVALIPDNNILTILNTNFQPITAFQLGFLATGSPICYSGAGGTTIVVAAYGSTMSSFTPGGSIGWSVSAPSRDTFSTAPITDGLNVYVGTEGGNMVGYAIADGTLLWIAKNGNGTPIATTPTLFNNTRLTYGSGNFIYSVDTVRTRAADYTVTLSGIGQIVSSPILKTVSGSTWMYFVTTCGQLYGCTGFDRIPNPVVGENANLSGWVSAETNILTTSTPLVDSSGSVYVSTTNSSINLYPAYWQGTQLLRSQSVVTSGTAQSGTQFNISTSSVNVPVFYTAPMISRQNRLYALSYSNTNNTSYLHTIN